MSKIINSKEKSDELVVGMPPALRFYLHRYNQVKAGD
jgi:hypothetical protein